ncbi:MAG TPA: sodium:calcium antiporter [Solirubrobacterales bacterium]|nr:sodium:calcium antiporter [Solirubrobacterales bacterium]
MAIDLLIIAATLAVLAVAADRFVISAAEVARLLGASPLFIGVVLIGVGTSLPDWLVSAFAAADGQDGIAVGNFVGSNTVNVGLALGIAAILAPLLVSSRVLRREAVLSVGAVLVLALALIGGIGRIEGIVLLLALPVAFWIVRPAHPPPGHRENEEGSLPVELGIALVTLAATVGASRLLVDSASDVALELGISEAFIGLSLVAIGTSLPEIVVGIQSVRRGETDLVIGNVLGSNMVNSLGIAGTAALLTPAAPLDSSGLGGAIVLMAGFAVVAGVLLATGRRLVRWEGIVLVAIYCATLPLFA